MMALSALSVHNDARRPGHNMPKSHFLAIASDAKNKIVAASASLHKVRPERSTCADWPLDKLQRVLLGLVLVSGRKPKSDSRSLNLLEVLSGKAAPWWYTKSGLLSKVLFKSWQNFSRASAVANLVRSTEQGLARLSFPHPKL